MIGQRLAGRYEIASELGRGGMGVVYRARDPLLNRDVAVKLIPPNQLNAESEQRFQREAQVVAQMDHPAIVSIYDVGRHEGSLFFVMPLVSGTNLRGFLREDTRLDDLIDIGVQIAEALDYSHARGVVHRDIKPENIMVSREEGAGVRVRVMDFGLARAAGESRMTRTGTLLGTVTYLSPEQITGRGLDGRSDIYALGTVLYECVVGEPPFSGEAQAVVYRIVHEFPQSPRALGATIDADLEAIIVECLAKEPGRRPQRANDVAEALKRYRSGLADTDRARNVSEFTRTLQMQRPALAPFIGRARESAELQQRLNAAIGGECQFVLIGGEPGIGKTRLLDELEHLARARQIRVLHGRSIEQDRAFPYQGFCDVIQEHFRSKDSGSTPPPDFSDLAGDLVTLFPMLSEIREIGSAGGNSSTLARVGTAGIDNRTQIFELLARTLTRIAGGRPLVLLLEDLHQAEISIEALQYIIRRLGPTPTLIVGTFRSTEVDARHPVTRMQQSLRGDRRFASLALGPFTPSEHRSFLETLVGTGVSDSLAERLLENSEGNPFFTKELVRSLTDSGSMAKDDSGAWTLSAEASLGADALPATIQEAVERRIERLPDELRDLLSTAAVIGRSFDARDLEALAKAGDVDDVIDRLVEQGLIEEERESRGGLLSFSSGVLRDVLYASLSPRKRRSLHRRCAELIETRHAGRLERVLPQLVHHFYQGDVPEKAVEYGLRQAHASLEAFSAEEVARSAKTVLKSLDEDWRGDRAVEGEARLLLARALRMSGDIEGALRESAAAIRIFERERQPARAVGALVLSAETAWQARRIEETSRWLDKGLTAARAAGDTENLQPLLSLAATVANLLGEHDRAGAYLEELTRRGQGAGDPRAEDAVPRGGRLVVALVNPVKAVEPIEIRTVEEGEVLVNVYETLLVTDPQGHVVPALCASWDTPDHGRTFLLTLRDDVRFEDGHLLRAADVKSSIERALRWLPQDLPAAFAAIAGAQAFADANTTDADVSGVVVRSDLEVEIHLLEALPIYPALLSHRRTAIVREERPNQGSAPRILGTGPFRIVSHDVDRIVIESNPQYARGTRPNLEAIEFRLNVSATAIARGFRDGAIDLARDLHPTDLDDLLRDPVIRRGLVESPRKITYFVLFNCSTGRAAEQPALRQALSAVVDARDLVWRTLGRFAEPAPGLIPPGMFGHDAGRRHESQTRDHAIALLRAAGLTGAIRLRAAVHPILQDRYASLVKALFALWSDLGVEIDAEPLTMAAYLEARRQHGHRIDLQIGRWSADYDDPDNFTYTLFHSRAGELRTYFSSPEADRILEEARSETRPAAREALYRKFEQLLFGSSAVIPLFHEIDYRVAGPKVRGLELKSTAPYVNYAAIGKAAVATPSGEARWTSGGVVHAPMGGTVGTLDPAVSKTIEQAEVSHSMFETLTREAAGARIVPWLAAEFSAEDGGRRYRFRLRDDVRFHDGRRLTARDVRYSFERLLQSPDGDNRWYFSPIRGAVAVLDGETTDLAGFRVHSTSEFSIDLDEPIGFFPALISSAYAAIVPEDSSRDSVVGTGPYRVVAFEPGRRLELERHTAYWRHGYPRNAGLVFTFGVSPRDIVAGFRAGRFSIASDLAPADVDALRRDAEFAPGYRETPRLITYYVAFNIHRGPLSDRRVRRRFVHALDVARLVRQSVGRFAIPAASLIPPGLLAHDPTSVSRADVGGAIASGPPGTGIELTAALNPVYFGGYAAFTREVTSAAATVGLKIQPVNTTYAEFTDAMLHGTTDLVLTRWSADYPDPDTFASLLHTKGGRLGRLCGSPDVDQLIERGRAETTPAVRHAVYRQIEEIIAREALLLPLFHEQAYRFARPEVEGLTVHFKDPAVAYENLRLRSGS